MPELPFLNPTSEPRLVAANGGRPPLLTVQVVRAPDPMVAFGNGYLFLATGQLRINAPARLLRRSLCGLRRSSTSFGGMRLTPAQKGSVATLKTVT